MGLAITESLVKLQGGSLGLEANLAKGAVSISVCPWLKLFEKRPHASSRSRGKRRNAKDSYIEDDRMASHLLESQLSSSGYEVISCNQPEHALEMAADLQAAGNHAGPADEATSGWEILLQLKYDLALRPSL